MQTRHCALSIGLVLVVLVVTASYPKIQPRVTYGENLTCKRVQLPHDGRYLPASSATLDRLRLGEPAPTGRHRLLGRRESCSDGADEGPQAPFDRRSATATCREGQTAWSEDAQSSRNDRDTGHYHEMATSPDCTQVDLQI